MDDCQIIELFFARSEQAITELSAKYSPACMRVADHILNNRLDSEECVNDAYLAVWHTIPPERPDPLISYVCRIVRNLALKKYHENTAQKRNSIYDIALDEAAECFPSAVSVEGTMDAIEAAGIIDGFLETLEPRSRIMFIRRYWYCDEIGDIAALFHTSRHYVSVRLSRIRKALKKHLIKEGVFL